MRTTTITLTVNSAFLQEIKEDHVDLWDLFGRLSEMAAEGAIEVPTRHLQEMLAQLRDRLAFHFALEEGYGYFEEPLEVAPRLSHKADKLREEHAALYSQVCDLCGLAERLPAGDGTKVNAARKEVMRRFREFAACFYQHETAETALIQEAFLQDIGVGD